MPTTRSLIPSNLSLNNFFPSFTTRTRQSNGAVDGVNGEEAPSSGSVTVVGTICDNESSWWVGGGIGGSSVEEAWSPTSRSFAIIR
ncbi:hypothetical protein VIGAN_01215700 [Vigna angularis var. angularis]|uniref:Uncharacterized protein n=1 Tax=Vigna angularis var. angularis TaxID=157739 RepID=A0A0S3R1T0_PHAAN|nr:hypothetical protein VIGAN_01215700 [Vigna angularis var. angularis]